MHSGTSSNWMSEACWNRQQPGASWDSSATCPQSPSSARALLGGRQRKRNVLPAMIQIYWIRTSSLSERHAGPHPVEPVLDLPQRRLWGLTQERHVNSHGFSRGAFRLEKRIRPRCCLDDFLGFDGSVPWRYNGETVPCKAIEFGAPPKTFTFRPKTHGSHRKGGPKITGLKFKGQASNSCCCVISMLSLNEIPWIGGMLISFFSHTPQSLFRKNSNTEAMWVSCHHSCGVHSN